MRVAHASSSSGSVLVVALPATVTKANGGRSSSTHSDTRGSRRMALPLIVSALVMKTMSSPSRTTHTGATWGLPSARTTANFPVRAGSAPTKPCHHPSGAW